MSTLTTDDYETAKSFYNDRYSKGYMADWDETKKNRVFKMIKDLNLPKTGVALDFGCGNGVWSNVIKKALPEWQVFGVDVSSKAISNAKLNFPDLNFFELKDQQQFYGKVDFLFSHHVLEHVFDIHDTFNTIDKILKASSSMLHILPCGNDESFENRLSTLIKDGIDKQTGVLFYEDPGHMRRLNTRQMKILAKDHMFILSNAFYSYQYWSAIKEITASNIQFILKITNHKRAKDKKSQVDLKKLRKVLLRVNILRRPSMAFERLKHSRQKNYTIPSKIMDLFLSSFLLFSYSTNSFVTLKAENEWNLCKNNENGGEMYLYFIR